MAKGKPKPKPPDPPLPNIPAGIPKPNIPAKEQAILADIFQTFRRMYGTGRGRKRRRKK